MNTFQSALSSPRFNRALFWVGAAALAAGVVVLIVKLVPSSNGSSTAASPNFKPQIEKPQPTAKTAAGQPITRYSQIDPQAKLAVRKFILGAVAGKDYAGSWQYVAPAMKKGYTREEWVTAKSHPVIPYPVYKFDKLSQFHLEYAHSNDIYATVSLTAPPKTKIRPTVFAIGLVKKKGTRSWTVNYWMPRYTPGVFVGDEKQ
jgi:hypothetical protein